MSKHYTCDQCHRPMLRELVNPDSWWLVDKTPDGGFSLKPWWGESAGNPDKSIQLCSFECAETVALRLLANQKQYLATCKSYLQNEKRVPISESPSSS